MNLIPALGYLIVTFVFWLAIFVPPSILWEWYWKRRQVRLREHPDGYPDLREERLLAVVGWGIMFAGAAAAFMLMLLFRDWLGS